MGMTLLEYAKGVQDDYRRGVIEIYGSTNDILFALPFSDINGNAVHYSQEAALPGIAFRGINEGYTASAGVLNPVTETLAIAGGDIDVDVQVVRMFGQERRTQEEVGKIKALTHAVAQKVIKGDSTAISKEFDGLQRRLTGSQVISNGSSSGGDPLSLAKLDEAIDAVDSPTHLIMSKAMRRRLSTAARTTSVTGNVDWLPDAIGRRQMVYQDLPILIADENSNPNAALAFNESGTGGGSTATSIYVVSFGDGMLTGIQNSIPDARDLGEISSSPVYRSRVEWAMGIALWHPRAAARLRDISNAAVTA